MNFGDPQWHFSIASGGPFVRAVRASFQGILWPGQGQFFQLGGTLDMFFESTLKYYANEIPSEYIMWIGMVGLVALKGMLRFCGVLLKTSARPRLLLVTADSNSKAPPAWHHAQRPRLDEAASTAWRESQRCFYDDELQTNRFLHRIISKNKIE